MLYSPPLQEIFTMTGRPLTVMPLASTASLAGTTGGPVLFGPLEEMSITFLFAENGMDANSSAENAIAPAIEVSNSLERGRASSREARSSALSDPSTSVHGSVMV